MVPGLHETRKRALSCQKRHGTEHAIGIIVSNELTESDQPMTHSLTAEQAIARSEECDEIVVIDGSNETHATLKSACSDSVERYVDHEDGYTLTEYWRNDPESSDGMLWRVHVRDA